MESFAWRRCLCLTVSLPVIARGFPVVGPCAHVPALAAASHRSAPLFRCRTSNFPTGVSRHRLRAPSWEERGAAEGGSRGRRSLSDAPVGKELRQSLAGWPAPQGGWEGGLGHRESCFQKHRSLEVSWATCAGALLGALCPHHRGEEAVCLPARLLLAAVRLGQEPPSWCRERKPPACLLAPAEGQEGRPALPSLSSLWGLLKQDSGRDLGW